MILTDAEYASSVRDVALQLEHTEGQRRFLKQSGLTPEEVERVLEPSICFRQGMVEEIEQYERIKNRDFSGLTKLESLGSLLIALRIANGISQAGLAERITQKNLELPKHQRYDCHSLTLEDGVVDEWHLQKAERNEYFGIPLAQAETILAALGEQVTYQIQRKSSGSV